VREETRESEEKADDEVRAHGAPRIEPDSSQERRDPQRAEDDAERTADEADHEAEDDRRNEPRLGGRLGSERREQEIEPVPGEDGGDACK
jgi:hypothetical protein